MKNVKNVKIVWKEKDEEKKFTYGNNIQKAAFTKFVCLLLQTIKLTKSNFHEEITI